ncbi:MAG TPA: S9 family peptidase [Candidatus Cybelea sp.]|nr:S9 family peptidase [Candidatus Cybelea sp.]
MNGPYPSERLRHSARARGPLCLVFCLAAISLLALTASSQQTVESNQFLRDAFLKHAYSGRPFGPARWLMGGQAYTTVEPAPAGHGGRDIVRYDTATGNREVLISASDLVPPGATEPLELEDYDWSSDMNRLLVYTNSKRVWRLNTRGDYWVFDRRARTLRKLGGDAEGASLMFATFSPDGSKVAYVHSNNLYVEDGETGAIAQLTRDGSATIINGTSDWVYEEELDIRNAYRWSPDGKHIAYWQFNTSTVENYALIYDVGAPYDVATHIPYPQFGVYPLVKEVPYPQPGTKNSLVRIGVVRSTGGETKWMDITGDPEKSYIARMEWAGNSDSLVIQHLNRLQNQNEVVLADAATASVSVIHTERDKAWVDVVDDLEWLAGGKDFLWVSEKDGWRHVYTISRDGQQEHLSTPGAFDVIEVLRVDPAEQWIYYIASPEKPTDRYLYRSRLDGSGSAERVTPPGEPGSHSYDISPNFNWAFHRSSTIDAPPTTELVRFPDLHVERVLEDNAALRAKLADLIAPVEYFKVDIGGGTILDAWMIKPKNFSTKEKYPVLVYVYGEPAGQTVENGWDGETSLWHRFIANEGYIVVSFDNHGTPAPRGREWRKSVYGEVGVLSSKEQAAALGKFEETYGFVDASRVAVWGWSGGGSNTLNLMFRSPELYKVGMSVAPVPDQRLYDSIYQERYMGLPEDNAAGYKAASAINYAQGLRGHLLIVHSQGDDNVHYQGTELLINRLVELGKQFDFMEYPGRTHSLAEGAGTHYHLYCLLTRYLEDHLAPGPAH